MVCSDLIMACFDLLMACSDLIMACSYLIIACSDLIMSCSDLIMVKKRVKGVRLTQDPDFIAKLQKKVKEDSSKYT